MTRGVGLRLALRGRDLRTSHQAQALWRQHRTATAAAGPDVKGARPTPPRCPSRSRPVRRAPLPRAGSGELRSEGYVAGGRVLELQAARPATI